MSEISPAPYSELANSFSWLEWFRQVRDKVNSTSRYGSFSNTTNHTLSAINAATLITFDSQPIVDGISLSEGSKILIPKTGVYSFDFSVQISSSNASVKNLWFWPRVNGVDAPGVTMKQSIDISGTTIVASRSGVFSLNINDYLQVYWAADSLNVTLEAQAATAFAPATPSVLLSVKQIG
jgi:hypothetical protein